MCATFWGAQRLQHIGFLTYTLSVSDSEGTQEKFMGVVRLKPQGPQRRMDLIVVPYAEIACALLYFTGSGIFNRSMRLLARKKGMSLSQHSLNR